MRIVANLQLTEDLQRRFWNKVSKSGNGCWEWIGAKKESGHGVIGIGTRKNGLIRVHRLSYIIHYGPISRKIKVCHTCDNPPCVKPDHLFLGTQLDNVRDCIAKGRHVYPPYVSGENVGNHKLFKEDIPRIREYAQNGMTHKNIASIFSVSRANISYIIRGNTWRTA